MDRLRMEPPMRIATILLAVCLSVAAPLSAHAATLAELVGWCAPESAGGRPQLCSLYLESALQSLASPEPSLNGGVRVCVPDSADRAQIVTLIRAYSHQHPASTSVSGMGELGLALKDHYPCPK
jgi:Rap1a immunity proteins